MGIQSKYALTPILSFPLFQSTPHRTKWQQQTEQHHRRQDHPLPATTRTSTMNRHEYVLRKKQRQHRAGLFDTEGIGDAIDIAASGSAGLIGDVIATQGIIGNTID